MSGTFSSVLVFGTFDGLHRGHKHFLREARALGTHLTAVLPPDVAVHDLKKRNPKKTFELRKKMLLNSALVDCVVEGDRTAGTWAILTHVQPDCIALGYDQTELKLALEAYFDTKQMGNRPALVALSPFKDGKTHSSTLHT